MLLVRAGKKPTKNAYKNKDSLCFLNVKNSTTVNNKNANLSIIEDVYP